MLLKPQDSFPKELWIKYALELEKQNKLLKSHLLIKTCEKIYWSLFKCGREIGEKLTPIHYSNEACKELAKELPDIFRE
jgi:hypothetical protein